MITSRIIILAAAIGASCAVLPLAAQNIVPKDRQPASQDAAKGGRSNGNPLEVKDLLGRNVVDSQDQNAGTVKDLFIDLQDGRIAQVIVSTGVPTPIVGNSGWANSGPFSTGGGIEDEEVTAVPPACCTINDSGKSLRISITRKALRNAPRFSMSHWKDMASSSNTAGVYHRYAIPMPVFGNLERAATLLDESVRNEQNQSLGRVNDLVVDLPAGRVDEVILATGGFLGIHSKLTAVAPQSFVYDPDRGKLRLNMRPESLNNAPHFKAREWKTSLISQVEPAAAAGTAGCIPATAPDRSGGLVRVGYLQGENDPRWPADMTSDSLITGAIIREIIQERLAGVTSNVRVITRDGFVTLRGAVSDEYYRRRVGAIAAAVVSWNRVDNRVVVVSGSAW